MAECSYQEVECENKCGESLERRHLEKHLRDDCSHRVVSCNYCSLKVVFELLEVEMFLFFIKFVPVEWETNEQRMKCGNAASFFGRRDQIDILTFVDKSSVFEFLYLPKAQFGHSLMEKDIFLNKTE